jgi:hypothetical protein
LIGSDKIFGRDFKYFFVISSSKEGSIPWEYPDFLVDIGKIGFWRNRFNRIALGMNVIDEKIRAKDRRWHFLQAVNEREFICQYDQITFKIAMHNNSLNSGLKSRILRNSGTNIEPGRSNWAQEIVFLGRKTRKEACWLQKSRILSQSTSWIFCEPQKPTSLFKITV